MKKRVASTVRSKGSRIWTVIKHRYAHKTNLLVRHLQRRKQRRSCQVGDKMLSKPKQRVNRKRRLWWQANRNLTASYFSQNRFRQPQIDYRQKVITFHLSTPPLMLYAEIRTLPTTQLLQNSHDLNMRAISCMLESLRVWKNRDTIFIKLTQITSYHTSDTNWHQLHILTQPLSDTPNIYWHHLKRTVTIDTYWHQWHLLTPLKPTDTLWH